MSTMSDKGVPNKMARKSSAISLHAGVCVCVCVCVWCVCGVWCVCVCGVVWCVCVCLCGVWCVCICSVWCVRVHMHVSCLLCANVNNVQNVWNGDRVRAVCGEGSCHGPQGSGPGGVR